MSDKKHRPVGAYLPLGQLDGDCSCGDGAYPCPAAQEESEREALAVLVRDVFANDDVGNGSGDVQADLVEELLQYQYLKKFSGNPNMC